MRRSAITGGGAGIGRALALALAARGDEVLISDIDAAAAAATCAAITASGGRAMFVSGDLRHDAGLAALQSAIAAGPPLDLLINNAGISAVGPFEQLSWAQQQAVFELNLRAPLLLTSGVLRENLLAPMASLVFISSLSFFTGYPGAVSYAASKDGLASYARSLRVALQPQGYHVLTVFPGPTRTEHARRYSPDNRREGRRMAPEVLAAKIVEAIAARQAVLIPSFGLQLFARLGQYAPALTTAIMRRTIFEKLG